MRWSFEKTRNNYRYLERGEGEIEIEGGARNRGWDARGDVKLVRCEHG
jgi:hypothetical protein